jgi:hypothetical protein
VHPLARAGGHPSGTAVAGSLVRSTREHRAGRPQALAQLPRPGGHGALLTLLRVQAVHIDDSGCRSPAQGDGVSMTLSFCPSEALAVPASCSRGLQHRLQTGRSPRLLTWTWPWREVM